MIIGFQNSVFSFSFLITNGEIIYFDYLFNLYFRSHFFIDINVYWKKNYYYFIPIKYFRLCHSIWGNNKVFIYFFLQLMNT